MNEEKRPVNILVTLDENYITQLNVMLYTLIRHNEGCFFEVYLLHTAIPDEKMEMTGRILAGRGRLTAIKVSGLDLNEAPVTSRYPKEMYYRIFAAFLLPKELDRVLYLDPDIVVNGGIESLYGMPVEDYFFAAASHIRSGLPLSRINEVRLGMDDESTYINSGVILMNLKKLRAEQNPDEVFEFIEKYKSRLVLPDQDVISGLYGNRILPLDSFRYNMTEMLFAMYAPFNRSMTVDWVRENSVIIHYCGRNKPWKELYIGVLDSFYREAAEGLNREYGQGEDI